MGHTAVVILNWNGEKLLQKFLPPTVENTSGAVVIVADNGSTDGSVAWIRRTFPGLRLLEFDRNYGFAEGYNRAIQLLDGYENIVLLNSDAAPAPGWIPPLVEMLGREGVVAVQPKILAYNDPTCFEYAGAAGGLLDRNGYPYCRGRVLGHVEKDCGQYDDEAEIFWASGAALAVKRDAYLQAGGLDTDFFAHMEEIDLCWRLKLAGGKVMYQPRSTVYHLGGGSLDSRSPKKTYLNFRNNLLMLHKNLPEGSRKTKLLFRRRLLDTLAWLKFILSGKFAHAGAILKAHKDFRTMKGNYTAFPRHDLLAKECNESIFRLLRNR